MKNIIKPLCLLTGLLCTPAVWLHAQVDEKLKADIVSTGYVHSPLPLDETKAFETFGLKKKVLETMMLCDMEDFSKWSHKGIGKIGLTDERSKSGKHSLRLEAPAHPEKILGWGLGRGTCMASYDIGGVNWEGYNRLKFYIYPTCEGARSIYLNLYVENDGEIKVPDIYGREGYHEINLKNNQWNECFVEMSGLARDKVTKISFAIEVFGKERTMGDSLRFDVDAVELQKVENPETVKGWMPAQNRIIFSTTGYGIESPKSAIVNVEKHGGQFQLKDAATQAIVYTGPIRKEKTGLGEFETIDFSDFKTQGRYVIQVGDVTTLPFYIHKDVWEDSAWRMVNFLFCERDRPFRQKRAAASRSGYFKPARQRAARPHIGARFLGQELSHKTDGIFAHARRRESRRHRAAARRAARRSDGVPQDRPSRRTFVYGIRYAGKGTDAGCDARFRARQAPV